MSAVVEERPPRVPVGAGSLEAVLTAWSRYAELRAAGAPLAQRLAAWGVLQDERRWHRASAGR